MRAFRRRPRRAARLSIGALSRATGRAGGDAAHVGAAVRVPGRRAQALRPPGLPAVRRAAPAAHGGGHRREAIAPATSCRPPTPRSIGCWRRPGPGPRRRAAWAMPGALSTDDALALVEAFDADRLTAALLGEWGRLGPLEFLTHLRRAARRARRPRVGGRPPRDPPRALPVGAARRSAAVAAPAAGSPGVRPGRDLRHAARRDPRARPADGGAAARRRRPPRRYLGTDTPPAELAALAADLPAAHVALSISSAADAPAATRHLRGSGSCCPHGPASSSAGGGAPAPRPGVTVVADFDALDAWARRPPRRRPTAGARTLAMIELPAWPATRA